MAAVVGGCVGTVVFDFVDGIGPAQRFACWATPTSFTRAAASSRNSMAADTGLVFDPQRVQLTTVDGRVIDFERVDGVTRIQDSNDNTLTITAGGIEHSGGRSIAFARDGLGRITSITDPAGNHLAYGYDSNGDHSLFTDQLGNETTFNYDGAHNLVEILDPRGNSQRGEYSADGRLIAVIDETGNRIDLTHDLNGRAEVIRDRLGRTIRQRVRHEREHYAADRRARPAARVHP